MDKRLVKTWIKNLRSGKYAQGRHSLYERSRTFFDGTKFEAAYCCLGVACIPVAKKQKKSIKAVAKSAGKIEKQSLLSRLGLTADVQERLIDMNDYQGKSFKQIANYIEKHILNAKA